MFSMLRFPELIAEIPLYTAALALMLTAIFALVINDRRATLFLLLLQYAAAALLSHKDLYTPLVLVRFATGGAVCGLLYLSAQRAQRASRRARAQATDGNGAMAQILTTVGTGGMNIAFRIVLATLGVLCALGLWQRYPTFGILQGYGFSLFVMMVCALLIILARLDPLQRGIGLLMMWHGVAIIYLYLEQSFLAIVLLDALDVLIALAIAHFSEAWLSGLERSEL